MASAFDMQKIGYALEKISDFILGSSPGRRVPGWADTSTRVIVEGLRAFEEKLGEDGTSAGEIDHHLGTAIYATCQLQSYVTGDRSDIANQNAAWVYRDFLVAKIEELLRLEESLDSGEGQ